MLLVVLIFLTQGVFLPVLLLGGLVFVVTGLHYLVWGWWLGDYIRRQEALVEEASQAFGDLPFAEAMAQPQRLDDDA